MKNTKKYSPNNKFTYGARYNTDKLTHPPDQCGGIFLDSEKTS